MRGNPSADIEPAVGFPRPLEVTTYVNKLHVLKYTFIELVKLIMRSVNNWHL